MNVKLPDLSGLLQTVEKIAAYFGVAGVGVADYPHLPVALRAVLAGVSAALVVVDRTTIAPTTKTPSK
jgi:hypothetical protein